MKLRSLFVIALAACVCSATAQKRKKAPKKAVTVEAAATHIKPVGAEEFSYAMGVAQGSSLRDYLMTREGVDSLYLGEAIKMMQGNTPKQQAQLILAQAAGLKIAQMNDERVISEVNKAATGKSDTTYMSKEAFVRGLADVVLKRPHVLREDSAQAIVERQFNFYKNKYKLENQAFLAANKQKKGVVTLPSGLQYRILKAGKGALATDTTLVEVNYEGRLTDGTIFDSSYKRGQTAKFKPTQVIKGWTEALKLMPEGSTWELYLPYDLAYGKNGTGSIPPYSTLIFKVEIVKVGATE